MDGRPVCTSSMLTAVVKIGEMRLCLVRTARSFSALSTPRSEQVYTVQLKVSLCVEVTALQVDLRLASTQYVAR